MKKLIFGKGINDAGYTTERREIVVNPDGSTTKRLVWYCKAYKDWTNMLARVFSEVEHKRHPAYKGTSCIEDWLLFSNFNSWRDSQGNLDGKQLDKDILTYRNKVYSPETCAYVLTRTNGFVLECTASLGEHPIGVSWKSRNKKFQASCSNPFTGAREYLGLFTTPEEAHEAWRKRKHELAQLVAETESDPRVVEALKKRYSVEEWYG